MTNDGLVALAARLGVELDDHPALEAALTHRSYANEQGLAENYERLEFLGDAVLGLISAEWLFGSYPGKTEGGLSELNAYLVSQPVLAGYAHELGLGELLRLGVGEERSGGRLKASLLADSLEAVVGALFLGGGLEAARSAVGPMFEQALARRTERDHPEAKTRLQELTQARLLELPEYRHVGEEGPDHHKCFSVECWIDGRLAGSGKGRSKKLAEQRAAGEALAALSSADVGESTD